MSDLEAPFREFSIAYKSLKSVKMYENVEVSGGRIDVLKWSL
jgi:hypothetical protein